MCKLIPMCYCPVCALQAKKRRSYRPLYWAPRSSLRSCAANVLVVTPSMLSTSPTLKLQPFTMHTRSGALPHRDGSDPGASQLPNADRAGPLHEAQDAVDGDGMASASQLPNAKALGLLLRCRTRLTMAAKSPLCTPEDPTLASMSLVRMSGALTLVKRHVMVSLTLLLATSRKRSSR